ncbi:class I SAM-dependent methyltransferase [Paenibacillus arenilitoris]|uniref:Class I SAM-dependent methyltransferase n=1 Tax=Paenibacillus arenilitoris TaxID=2772299 RepID=A0A927CR48_9BACL|nr:class I SAM-dependent methyltransferase [Paenibacillus arenilitoris]MBD2871298.1 class I SAM-dependent methyltransferase [Paenibacillus arenilitoris]
MSDTVKKQFDAAARDYDRQRRQLIPCFDDFYGTAADWVRFGGTTPRILDLGAGTGLLSAFMRDKFPDAALTLIDLSDEMLKEARARFKDDPNVRYVAGDYTAYPYEERYDAVVSSLSIHHLPHEAKRALFRTVHGLLADGGVFVNADQAAGATPYFDESYMARWREEIRKSGLPAQAIDASIERRKLDINAGAFDQLQWLREAGFADCDCVYKHNGFAVFVAIKR